jgi:nitroreductase
MKKTTRLISLATLAVLGAAGCGQTQESSSENAVIENIMNRRSIRKYKDQSVEREKLQQIAECGVNAPNGMNRQEWEVRIVDSKEAIDSVTAVFTAANPEMVRRDENFKNMFRNAPAVIAIAVPEGDSGLNAGLMAENMILAAQSLGLGTCCLGGPVAFLKTNPDAAWFLEGLKFSEGYNLCLMIAVGYPDETPEAKARDLDKIKFIDWE